MNQTEAIDFIYNLFINENKELALRGGMSETDFMEKMSQSEQSLKYIFGNMYNKMKESNILA